MIRISTFILVISLLSSFTEGQTVSTFLTGSGLNGPDGFAIDTTGNLIVANWGGGSGTTVLKITPDASVTVIDSTSDAPDGLAFDSAGYLYISDYNSGKITRTSPAGVKTDFATGLNHPSALAFDNEWNLYVSNYGGGTVSKITPGGSVSVFASGFSRPIGLVFDPDGNLYVSNYNTGIVNKVTPDGNVSVFATVPNPSTSRIQYLARGQSGNLYLPAYGHHKIYKISPAGNVNVLAGTGVAGGKDGPADSAQFNGPNSIALTAEGNLFVSEYNANRIRLITGVEFPVGIKDRGLSPSSGFILEKNFPNPFRDRTYLLVHAFRPGSILIQITTSQGDAAGCIERSVGEGNHLIPVDNFGLSGGIYYATLWSEGRCWGTLRLLVRP